MNVSKLVTTGLILGASVLGASSPAAAFAALPAIDEPRIALDYSDLDLSTADGIEALHRRIVLAARRVCSTPNQADLRIKELARECRAQAIEAAVRSIGNAELAAVHAAGRRRG